MMEENVEGKAKSAIRLSAAKLVLYLGTGLAGIMVARLLGPGDYGVVAIVLSIAGILGVVSDLNLSNAAIRFGSEHGAKSENYVATAFLLRIIIGAAGLLFFIFAAKPMAARYGVPSLFIVLVAFGYMLQSSLALRAAWSIERHFRLLAAVEGVTGVFYFVVMLAFAYFFRLAGVFYAIVLISAFMGASSFLKYRPGSFDPGCLKKMVPFGLWATLASISVYVVQNFDKWFLGLYVTKEQLGYYALAYKSAWFLMLVPIAVQVVTYPEFSRLFSKKNFPEMKRLINRTIKLCLVYALAGSALIVGAFHLLVKSFLTKYSAAEPLLPFILVPFILEAGIGAPSAALMGSMKIREMAGITLAQALIAATVGRALAKSGGVWGAIAALWIIYAISSVLYIWRINKNVKTLAA